MEIHIIDLKTGTIVKITDYEQFKNISIGHKIIINHKNILGIDRFINGTICSIEHEINQDNKSFEYILRVKIY